ncbi:MAG: nucleotidyltransferase family protein [Clostridia bacterium]|nr:nucleotidyltransferase family protein [Clostridia bacterium]
MNETQKQLLQLIRAALQGEGKPLPENADVAGLYELATRHGVLALFYYGAVACGVSAEHPIVKSAAATVLREAMLGEKQLLCGRLVTEAFEREGIDHLPLKGLRQKSLYPKAEMRAMGDLDILIREEDHPRILPLMESLGFAQTTVSDHEFVFQGKGITVELHRRLIPSYNKDYYAYFGDGWNHASSVDGSHAFVMPPEDEFIYLLVHFAKHYRDGGIGLRHVTDLYVFLKSVPLEEKILEEKLSKLRLFPFYQNLHRALAVMFDGAKEDETTALIADTVFAAGVYGTAEGHLLSGSLRVERKEKSTRRVSRMAKLLFPDATRVKNKYPVVAKHPVLLAIYWPYYFVARVFDRRKREEFKQNVSAMDKREVSRYEESLQKVGLDFYFE